MPNPKLHHRARPEPPADSDSNVRASIGGYPILPAGHSWPVCSEDDCGRRMSLFPQIEIEDRFGLPLPAGAVLSVFCLHGALRPSRCHRRQAELNKIPMTPRFRCS